MVNPKLKDELNDQLCEAMLSLETVDECYQFFEDLCTISELKAMSQRLEVARMLRAGHTYALPQLRRRRLPDRPRPAGTGGREGTLAQVSGFLLIGRKWK